MNRIERELKTIGIMIDVYCRHHHAADSRCTFCRELFEYSRQRVLRCPFGVKKPVCAKCLIHCFKPEMREKIKTVMRFSGPKMSLFHPVLAVRHLIDACKKPPSLHGKRK